MTHIWKTYPGISHRDSNQQDYSFFIQARKDRWITQWQEDSTNADVYWLYKAQRDVYDIE